MVHRSEAYDKVGIDTDVQGIERKIKRKGGKANILSITMCDTKSRNSLFLKVHITALI